MVYTIIVKTKERCMSNKDKGDAYCAIYKKLYGT